MVLAELMSPLRLSVLTGRRRFSDGEISEGGEEPWNRKRG